MAGQRNEDVAVWFTSIKLTKSCVEDIDNQVVDMTLKAFSKRKLGDSISEDTRPTFEVCMARNDLSVSDQAMKSATFRALLDFLIGPLSTRVAVAVQAEAIELDEKWRIDLDEFLTHTIGEVFGSKDSAGRNNVDSMLIASMDPDFYKPGDIHTFKNSALLQAVVAKLTA